MRILLVNPPVIRNNNKIDEFIEEKMCVAKIINSVSKILGNKLTKFLKNMLGLNLNITYGNRAGSRWPETFTSDIGLSWNYPYIMALTVSYLRQNHIQADMFDCVAEHFYSFKKFLKRVKDYNANIVIIETSTPTIDIDLYFAKKISKFTQVALAGPHITDNTISDLISNNPYVSYWLKGEYIKSALNMANTQKKGVYEIELVSNMDELPFMARDFKGFDKYYDLTVNTEKPQLFMFGSKGCPFNCSYCLWPATMFNYSCNLRSPENIIAEIRENLAKHPYKSIYFDDDTWNIGHERISKLCDYLKEIGLPWSMMGRLDCSPDWLFDKMVDCGCKDMRFGVETFNIDVLKKINKKLERIDIKRTLQYLSEKYPDLSIHICMMKNLPGQTDEMHAEDMRIIKELGFTQENGAKRFFQLSSCAPFPGTQLYKELIEKFGVEKLQNWNLYDGGQDTIMREFKELL